MMLRGRTRRDANEAAILDSFRRAGWAVLKINEPGAPDAVVFRRHLSGWWLPYLIEHNACQHEYRRKDEERLTEIVVHSWASDNECRDRQDEPDEGKG